MERQGIIIHVLPETINPSFAIAMERCVNLIKSWGDLHDRMKYRNKDGWIDFEVTVRRRKYLFLIKDDINDNWRLRIYKGDATFPLHYKDFIRWGVYTPLGGLY